MIKRIISAIMSSCIIFSFLANSYATSVVEKSQKQKNFISFCETYYGYQDLLLDHNKYGYMLYSQDLHNSIIFREIITSLKYHLKTKTSPSEEDYIRTIANIIMTYESDNATSIKEQSQRDHVKSFRSYAMDAKRAAVDIVEIIAGDSWFEDAISTTIDGLSLVADNTNDMIDALSNLETIVQEYTTYDVFLECLETSEVPELKSAAHKLRSSLKNAFLFRLNLIADPNGDINPDEYEFFSEVFFNSLKMTDLYENDKALAFFTDSAKGFLEKVGKLNASWDLGKLIGLTIGNISFGAENLLNRIMELFALYNISIVLASQEADYINRAKNTTTDTDVDIAISLYKLLIGTRIRGEYCNYSIIASDAGLLSWAGKKNREEMLKWYESQSEVLLRMQNLLDAVMSITSEDLEDYSADEAYTSLREFAETQFYLYGQRYYGYLSRKTDNGYSLSDTYRYDLSEVPYGALGFTISDLDDDGMPELLIVSLSQDTIPFTHAALLSLDHSITISVYEYVSGQAELSDEINLADEEISIVAELTYSDDLQGLFDCYLYGDNYIGIEISDHSCMLADGIRLSFQSLRYDGSQLLKMGRAYYIGSSGEYDDYYMNELFTLGIVDASWTDLFERSQYVRDYVSNYTEIVGVNTRYLVSVDQHISWMQSGEKETLKCTEITVTDFSEPSFEVNIINDEESTIFDESDSVSYDHSSSGNNTVPQSEQEVYRSILDMFDYRFKYGIWSSNNDELYYGLRTDEWGVADEASYMWDYYFNGSENDAGYCIRDLNGDGISELIVSPVDEARDGLIFDLYTYINGEVIHLAASGERDRFFLSTDNTIVNIGSGGALLSNWFFYHIVPGETDLSLNAALCYDGYENETDPWLYGEHPMRDEWGGVDYNYLITISDSEAQSIIDSYEISSIPLITFASY